MELAIVALNTIEVDLRQTRGRELASLDPPREARDRGVGNVGIVGWQRARVDRSANEAIARPFLWIAGERGAARRGGEGCRLPPRGWGERGLEHNLPRACPPLQ